jgi:hypothetical protein
MIVFRDFRGRDIRLTDERLAHILEHPEMRGQEQRIAETLLTPHSVILSYHDPAVHLHHRLFDETPISREYLVVVVKNLKQDAFVIIAFFTDKEKKGVHLWPQ